MVKVEVRVEGELPLKVTGLGEKDGVVPAGRPEIVK